MNLYEQKQQAIKKDALTKTTTTAAPMKKKRCPEQAGKFTKDMTKKRSTATVINLPEKLANTFSSAADLGDVKIDAAQLLRG